MALLQRAGAVRRSRRDSAAGSVSQTASVPEPVEKIARFTDMAESDSEVSIHTFCIHGPIFLISCHFM